jgi:hypothetical protein
MAQQSEANGSADMVVTRDAAGLLVHAPELAESSEGWKAKPVDERRILLVEGDADLGSAAAAGLASCPIEVFKDFLLGLARAAWSGLVAVDTGAGIKKIFFGQGRIVFAASSIIDDRLGEVIYREARITLDELTDAAAQVTKQRKFGQVLLANGVFSNVQLFDALKLQVRQIVRSCFMTDRVYFEMSPGPGIAPTEVVFTESTEDFVGECYSFGCAFRAFLSRLRAESEIVLLVPKEQLEAEHAPGTFTGDLLALIEVQRNVQELLNMSKLIDHYTIAALVALVNSGIASISPDVDADKRHLPSPGPLVAPLKTRLDAYSYLLGVVRKHFEGAQRDFPARDLAWFAHTLNPEGFPSVFLDHHAGLSKDSITCMLSQCAANPARVSYFAVRIESLIQFLLQVAGDNLDFQTAKKIRQDYRSIAG